MQDPWIFLLAGQLGSFGRLENLAAGTAYYCAIADSEGLSRTFWFRTAPDRASVSADRALKVPAGTPLFDSHGKGRVITIPRRPGRRCR